MSGFKQISNLKFEAVSLPEPLHCCVKGCSNTSAIKLENSNESSVKAMFKVIQNSSIEYEKIGTQYVVKRRNSVQSQAWISNIKKHNGQLWEPDANSHVCHGHFLTGKPSIDKNNVDFAPTIFPLLHKMERMNDTRNRGRNENIPPTKIVINKTVAPRFDSLFDAKINPLWKELSRANSSNRVQIQNFSNSRKSVPKQDLFKCQQCKQEFHHENELQIHFQIVHEKSLNPSEAPYYINNLEIEPMIEDKENDSVIAESGGIAAPTVSKNNLIIQPPMYRKPKISNQEEQTERDNDDDDGQVEIVDDEEEIIDPEIEDHMTKVIEYFEDRGLNDKAFVLKEVFTKPSSKFSRKLKVIIEAYNFNDSLQAKTKRKPKPKIVNINAKPTKNQMNSGNIDPLA